MLHLSLKITYVFSMILLFTSCSEQWRNGHNYISINNNSPLKLYYDLCTADYPDSSAIIPRYLKFIDANKEQITEPFSQGRISSNKFLVRIESWFYNKTYKSFMLFDYDLLMTENPETIAENYMVLVRYDVTLDDLDRLGWTLHYPPTPAMRDVHMYPPYEEVIENYNRMYLVTD